MKNKTQEIEVCIDIGGIKVSCRYDTRITLEEWELMSKVDQESITVGYLIHLFDETKNTGIWGSEE